MSEEMTTTAAVIELPDLRSRIKAEDSKARSIAKKSLEHVIECGRLLIELKSRVNHGNWRHEARQQCQDLHEGALAGLDQGWRW